MIVGAVKRREPIIPLTIRGARGRSVETNVIVDTGYTGWLSLPPRIIIALGLRWYSVGQGVLADGSVRVYDVYLANVVWDGRLRKVRVNELDAEPLLGMSLLRGFQLTMQVRRRGKVTIKRLG